LKAGDPTPKYKVSDGLYVASASGCRGALIEVYYEAAMYAGDPSMFRDDGPVNRGMLLLVSIKQAVIFDPG
jgi:hypothetical protein